MRRSRRLNAAQAGKTPNTGRDLVESPRAKLRAQCRDRVLAPIYRVYERRLLRQVKALPVPRQREIICDSPHGTSIRERRPTAPTLPLKLWLFAVLTH